MEYKPKCPKREGKTSSFKRTLQLFTARDKPTHQPKRKEKKKKTYMIDERAPKLALGFQTCAVILAMLSLTHNSRQQRGVKRTRKLTRFEVHHLSVKSIIRDGELGELQFVEPVDVLLALRPVIHDVFWGVAIYKYTVMYSQCSMVRRSDKWKELTGIWGRGLTAFQIQPALLFIHGIFGQVHIARDGRSDSRSSM